MDVTLNENGNVEYAFKNFGRQKLLSMNYYMTQSGNVYVHLKNKRTGKSISLGHDEYGELIALSADVAKMAKRLTKEVCSSYYVFLAYMVLVPFLFFSHATIEVRFFVSPSLVCLEKKKRVV